MINIRKVNIIPSSHPHESSPDNNLKNIQRFHSQLKCQCLDLNKVYFVTYQIKSINKTIFLYSKYIQKYKPHKKIQILKMQKAR